MRKIKLDVEDIIKREQSKQTIDERIIDIIQSETKLPYRVELLNGTCCFERAADKANQSLKIDLVAHNKVPNAIVATNQVEYDLLKNEDIKPYSKFRQICFFEKGTYVQDILYTGLGLKMQPKFVAYNQSLKSKQGYKESVAGPDFNSAILVSSIFTEEDFIEPVTRRNRNDTVTSIAILYESEGMRRDVEKTLEKYQFHKII